MLRRRARDSEEERTFHIIGTAHVSKRSIDEVRRVITALRPDTVCVELCATRYEALTDPSRWSRLDVAQVIREGRVPFVLASLGLQVFQRRIGARLGVSPGAELLAAVDAAREVGATVVLADRDVQATLRRTWHNIGLVRRVLLVLGLGASLLHEDDIDEAEVEALKNRERIADAMTELARAMPEVKVPLIDERDHYLASRIEETGGRVVVAIIGAAHVDGVLESVGATVDREALSSLPAPSVGMRSLPWLAPAFALAVVASGLVRGGTPWLALAGAWALPTACAGALFTLFAGGTFASVVAALVLTPLTTLTPRGAARAVVGLVEAWRRKPSVHHAGALGREVFTLGEAWRNPAGRTLFVAMCAGIGGGMGAIAAAVWVAYLVALSV